ncbi:hypothetical protein ACGFQG_32335 [Nocardia fluminea]|uniref:hypothetical protein n=1 Tax=Nocardia fluminea TaxID=134984 RepID=UPI00371B8DAC
MPMLRLLGCASTEFGCPALYDTDTDVLIVQGTRARDGAAVLVPDTIGTWAEPGMVVPTHATDTAGVVLVAGDPVDEETLAKLLLEDDEAAVSIPKFSR